LVACSLRASKDIVHGRVTGIERGMNVQHGMSTNRPRLGENHQGPRWAMHLGKRQRLGLARRATVSEHQLQPPASHVERSKVAGRRLQTACNEEMTNAETKHPLLLMFSWQYLLKKPLADYSRLYDYITSALPDIT